MEVLPTRQEIIDAFTHLFTSPVEGENIAYAEMDDDKEAFVLSCERIADKVLNYILSQLFNKWKISVISADIDGEIFCIF